MSIVMSGRSSDPKDNLKMKPAKGILKSSSSFEAPDVPSGSKRSHKNIKETTFDEMNILETLHPPGKDYGHMKIDEPKTPFERDVPDSIAVDPEALAKRISQEKEKSYLRGKSIEEDSEEEEEEPETPEEREKKKQFEMKRKAHYNEFLMAKKKLQELNDDEEDED